jgi:collagen type VII alpha
MNKLALIAALALVSLLLPPPSAQAQTTPTNATANSQLADSNTANALGVTTGTPTTGQQQTTSRSPTTGTICIEEMTATFCNVASGPNTNGYGSPGGSGSSGGTGSSGASGSAAAAASGGGAGVNTSSIPTCGGFPTANELCN